MVSIDNRCSYFERRVNNNPKLNEFYYFLYDKEINSSLIVDSNEQFFQILSSIQKNDETAFNKIYSNKSRSNPSKDSQSPFINDDYLIFALIIGVTKFNIDKTWIKNIISVRSRNSITITFENIINENFLSTSNQPEIILVFLYLCHMKLIDNDLLNNTFRNIVEDTSLFEKNNDFEILCSIRAYDLIIELKEASNGNEIKLLKEFNKAFKKRIKILSFILQIIVFSCIIYGLFKLPIYSPSFVKFLEDYNFVFTLLGAFGITLVSSKSIISNKLQVWLMRLLGYPKELIQKLEKK
jgi:hypothetical protein